MHGAIETKWYNRKLTQISLLLHYTEYIANLITSEPNNQYA